MSYAICTKCTKEYHWGAYRGARLANHPSPCCRAPGKAARSNHTPVPTKYCPDCGKAGLQWRKQMRRGNTPPLKDGHFDWSAMFCPRCQKWITPMKVKNPEETEALLCEQVV